MLCDLLGIPELVSVRVEHYRGTREKELKISDFGKLEVKALIVDDWQNERVGDKVEAVREA